MSPIAPSLPGPQAKAEGRSRTSRFGATEPNDVPCVAAPVPSWRCCPDYRTGIYL